MNYSKGPWTFVEPAQKLPVYEEGINDRGYQKGDFSMPAVNDANGFWVAHFGATDECIANAKLISAAPELYEAAKNLLEAIQFTMAASKVEGSMFVNEFQDLKEAVMKARGKNERNN